MDGRCPSLEGPAYTRSEKRLQRDPHDFFSLLKMNGNGLRASPFRGSFRFAALRFFSRKQTNVLPSLQFAPCVLISSCGSFGNATRSVVLACVCVLFFCWTAWSIDHPTRHVLSVRVLSLDRNPYCVVLVERVKVGETPTAAKTLSPVRLPFLLPGLALSSSLPSDMI